MNETSNAKIVGTMLGLEGHGIMTCYVNLEWDYAGIGVGGYVLGGESAIPFIKEILRVVGVDTWEELKGKYCRVEVGHDGRAVRIGNLIKNEWLSPQEFFKQYQ